MRSKTRLDITKLTSEKLNIDETTIDAVVRSFYSYLNDELASLNHINISVTGLGVFKIRKNKVEEAIKKQEKIIEMLDHRTKLSLSRYSTLYEAKYKLDLLNRTLDKLKEEEQRKQEFKNGESTDQSLEE
jgi:nucleoid DNA-binding protein